METSLSCLNGVNGGGGHSGPLGQRSLKSPTEATALANIYPHLQSDINKNRTISTDESPYATNESRSALSNGTVHTASAPGSAELVNRMPEENRTTLDRPDITRSNLDILTLDSSDASLAEALQPNAQGGLSAVMQLLEPTKAATNGFMSVQKTSLLAQNFSEFPQRPAGKGLLKRRRGFRGTKRGCITCRRRKKKCDKQHPECNNCLRIGFKCAGYFVYPYPQQQRPDEPAAVEPRRNYPEVTTQEIAPQHFISGGPSAVHTNSMRSGLLSVHNADRSMPTHIAGPKCDSRTRQAWLTGVWQSPLSVADCSPWPEDNLPTSMEAASYTAQAIQECGKRADMTEKEKMCAGMMYYPDDPQLARERQQCKIALAQYEKVQNPLHDISEEEKKRLLEKVLQIQPNCRPRMVVETPFTCHYGYNTHIGEKVMISEGCILIDDCGISIGECTWIGQSVQIISSVVVRGMQRCKGRNSICKGRPVKIESYCWIGPRSTILPGVTIRKGSCIPPGEFVTHDVAEFHAQSVSC